MRNLQNINIRYGSGVPVPVTLSGLPDDDEYETYLDSTEYEKSPEY